MFSVDNMPVLASMRRILIPDQKLPNLRAHEDKFCVTPVGHVFDMYAAHQGGQSLRTMFSTPSVHYERDGKPDSFSGLKGSASLQDKLLVLTVVNPHVSAPCETGIKTPGAAMKSRTATTLTASDTRAHNTFDQRDALVPQTRTIEPKPAFRYVFPPASVSKLELTLE
jgi:alpha-N-arabinofuranosidase